MPFLLRAAIVGGGAYAVGKTCRGAATRTPRRTSRSPTCRSTGSGRARRQRLRPARTTPGNELTKLKSLLDQGVLTQAEFDAQKQKILQGM